jgi:PAS domain S-box-containing protein
MSNSDLISEKKYKKLAKEMEMILDNIPGLVFYKDKKNNLIRVNKYFTDGQKLSRKEIEGKNCFDLYSKEQAQAYWDDDLEVINSGKPKLNIVEPWETEDGIRWVNTNKIPIFNDQGEIIGIIGFSIDISNRVEVEQKLKKAQEQLNPILLNLKDTIFVVSEDYKILFKNDTAHDFFGKEIIGKNCYEIIKRLDQPCEQCPMTKFAESDVCQFRFEQCITFPKRKETKFFDIIASRIENYNGQPAMVEMLRDITERKKIEEELKEYRDRLEYMVVEMTKELNCLYGLSKIIEEKDVTKEEILKRTVELLPPAWQFPEVTCVRIIIDSTEYKTENFKETKWKQASDIIIENEKIGIVEVSYLEEMPSFDEGPFIKEERDLIDEIAERLGRTFERIDAKLILKESEKKYRELFENAPDGISIIDSKGYIVDCNTADQKLIGYDYKEMVGKHITTFFKGDNKAIFKQKFPILKKIGSVEAELILVRKDGGIIPISRTVSKIYDDNGNHFGGIVHSRDVTKRKKAEEALKESEENLKILNEELEQKVEKRTKNLKLAMEDLKRSNAELEQFAYVASHDLQEPLRMVASFTQLLQKRYQDKLDEDANDFINYAVDGATRMQNLISDLLMFSRVGTRGKPFKNSDMSAVLEGVIATFRQLIKETNVTLTYNPLPMILADESQMIQLLQNLISNAIKFRSEEPPCIHISGEVKADKWIFSVSDNGIGLDSQFFDRIFIIFQRLHKKDEYDGTGIGLAICKKIIERHSGKIWVESELGKGSTFYFSIPKTEVRK